MAGYKPKKNASKRKKHYKFFLLLILLIVILLGWFANYVFSGLPSLEELENPKPQLASTVYSADGEIVGQFFRQNRVEVSIDSIPPYVVNALIATEDRKFYKHWGVDLQRFIQAMIKNIFLFRREGASTITQQLAKNLYDLKVKNETIFDTIVRKIREWITAIQIEKTYTKREILEMYFNISWFGHGAYGIETASRVYFDKDVSELTINDAGVLVALLKSAYYYDPFERYDNALRRRNLVLSNMVDAGFLSEKEYMKLRTEPIKLSNKRIQEGISGKLAPHFLEYVRQQMTKLSQKYGFDLYSDGLNIYTTLDSKMQQIANNAVKEHLDPFQKEFDKRWNWAQYSDILKEIVDIAIKKRPEYKNASTPEEQKEVYNSFLHNKVFIDSVKNEEQKIEVGFVCLDTKTGAIKAMIGGRNQNFAYGLNHVTQIRRQPGSAFKPIVYTVAIDNGLYPAYPILNQPFDYNGWSPQNFDKSTGGFMTLRQALANSVNIVSARLIIEGHAELWKIGRFAEKMGIKSPLDLVPSIVLGTSLVSPLEMASAFATLGNKGIYNEPISITKIEDKNGITIATFNSLASEAIPEETAYIVTDMMRSVIDEGTGIRARLTYNFQRPAAGKTGTTQDFGDAWFIGFTPQLTAAVWVGFDDRRVSFTGQYGQGSRAALPIWAIFMHDVYEKLNLPLEDFTPPASGNVVTAKFCKESIFEYGNPKLYSPDCSSGVYTDIINIRDLPSTFNKYTDRNVKVFDKYMVNDTTHHAVELK
ncbi:penicillin-binding protein 1A [Melioribacteraceae bacterium 4301-Me]|uniref:penicillin-binding protein 1A n=1 Tax=Pyranulibacter aquaticus TaxID=3163344 RepID=UPI00359B4047